MRVPIPPSPKKTLGQNFLHDENVLRKIVEFSQPTLTDTFLEIGAGTGALTALLVLRVKKLIAIELDLTLLPHLQQISGVQVVRGDIRKVDLSEFESAGPLRIIGNLPYYISTSILTHLISQRKCIADMILLFQEEVAQRILAPPSNHEYGLLSVVAQYFCVIERGFRISRNCFKPRPDVESRVLRFRFHPDREIDFPEFTEFLSHAFSQRRKKLRNNLLRTIPVTAETLDTIFRKMRIPEKARAENLSAEQFAQLILECRSLR